MGAWYSRVPKDYAKNLRFRRNLLRRASKSVVLQRKLKKACSEDILFYVNVFCWTYDPRKENSVIPFITYKYQDRTLLDLVRCIEDGIDVAIAKSRDMGASWMDMLALEWFWHFDKQVLSFLMVSRKESYVDEKGNPKALFHKLDFLHARQPKWLLPKGRDLGWNDPHRRLMHLENADTGSVIDGESTTGDVARGDRRTAILLDEYAAFEVSDSYEVLSSTRDATRCRIFNATPKGSGNAFYKVIHEMPAVHVIRLHWSEHPEKRVGFYTTGEDGKLKLLDNFRGTVEVREKGEKHARKVRFPEDYNFILDKKVRSPWYDNEYNRCASAAEVAQELDIDFLGSDYQFFDSGTIDRLIALYCRDPERICDMEFTPESNEYKRFVDNPKGMLKLWLNLDDDGRIDRDRRFVIGTDISAGTGASNSTASVFERQSGEKVAEYANPNILPNDFARFCMALGKFFNKARIVPDRSGPTGEVFVKRLITDGYGNIYYRRNEKKASRKVSDEPGVWLNPQARTALFEDYRDALSKFKIINRSSTAMKECLQFICKMDGTIEHSSSLNAQDPSGARSAHGDLVVSDALACLDLADSESQPDRTEPEIPENCLAARMQKHQESNRVKNEELSEGW